MASANEAQQISDDDQDAFAICDRNDASKQDQRKKAGYNEFATFNFLDEKCPDEKESKRNQKVAPWKSDEI